MAHKVVVVGAGPIGLGVAREIAARPSLALHAVVDVDPGKIGLPVEGVSIVGAIPAGASVAVLTTSSKLARLEPLVLDAVERGLHVVSTCEQLAWPWMHREIAERIDEKAKARGVCVLGTGVNPGFLMDALPLALTAPCRRVDRVRVERVQDASSRRRPFQDKVGVGMPPFDVTAALANGAMGHVGLHESAMMLGARLGLAIDGFVDDHKVIIAESVVERAGRVIQPGFVLGVEQSAIASSGSRVVVELFFRAVFAEPSARDRIVIDGDPPLDVTIAGGVPGDTATCAIVANAISVVVEARPGLRTMADVPIVVWSR